jgi:hypothetical protein
LIKNSTIGGESRVELIELGGHTEPGVWVREGVIESRFHETP